MPGLQSSRLCARRRLQRAAQRACTGWHLASHSSKSSGMQQSEATPCERRGLRQASALEQQALRSSGGYTVRPTTPARGRRNMSSSGREATFSRA